MTELDPSLDREKLHDSLQERNFLSIIDMLRGGTATDLGKSFQDFGGEVKRAADGELMVDFKEPLEMSDGLLGCLALMYEAENGVGIEDELEKFSVETQ